MGEFCYLKKLFKNFVLYILVFFIFSCAKPEVVNIESPDDKKLPLMIAMINAILEDKELDIKWENFAT